MIGLMNPATTFLKQRKAAMNQADVLIIDDDKSLCQSLSELIEDMGFSVHTIHDGEQATGVLIKDKPALVISDVHLPRINGIELLRLFRQHNRDTPVLMMSADDQAAIQDRAMSAGATAFLRKPIAVPLLTRAVHQYLGERINCQNVLQHAPSSVES